LPDLPATQKCAPSFLLATWNDLWNSLKAKKINCDLITTVSCFTEIKEQKMSRAGDAKKMKALNARFVFGH
jgi:hypothetical protein